MSEKESFTLNTEQYFESSTPAIKNIYIDFELFQDLRFGALLQKITTLKEMEYVYHKLDTFNNRIDNTVAEHFPALKFKDAELDAIINDPDKIDLLAFQTPFSSYYYYFLTLLRVASHHNRALSGKPIIMGITVNIENKQYPSELLEIFKKTIIKEIGDIRINFSFKKRYELPLSEYLEQDILFLYDYEQFVKPETATSNAFALEGMFMNKKIFTVPYINKTVVLDKDEYNFALESTKANSNLYCDFEYLVNTIDTTN